jgi:hypothetical protein
MTSREGKIFECHIGNPILVVVSYREFSLDKYSRKLKGWKPRFLMTGGRLTLTLCASGAPPYTCCQSFHSLNGPLTSSTSAAEDSFGRGRRR